MLSHSIVAGMLSESSSNAVRLWIKVSSVTARILSSDQTHREPWWYGVDCV